MEQGLSNAGVRVTTLTTDFGIDVKVANASEASSSIGRVHFPLLFNPYKIAPGMWRYLSAHVGSFDVVHIHALFSFAPTVAAWTCRAHDVPYIIRPLGTLTNYGLAKRRQRLKRLSIRCVEAANLRHAAAVQFTSTSELKQAEHLGIPLRGVVIPVGVASECGPCGPDLRSVYPQLAGRRIVLYLSRIDPKKNVEALIDAFCCSAILNASAALILAGDGEAGYVAALKQRAEQRGIAERIVWLGHVTGAQKSAAFAVADVFCLPSHSENFGIAVVEAMLAGLPCVLGEGVAIANELTAADAGLVIEPTGQAVASALESLVSDAEASWRMGLAGRQLASTRFSVGTMVRSLLELYKGVRRRDDDGTVEQADWLQRSREFSSGLR
jgi:glycosyltransferase involved in cell wall biosynthesis